MTIDTTTDWKAIDNRLLDPQWYAKGDFHDTYRLLRQQDPVHWTEDENYGHPYWAVMSYAAIREVQDRWDMFSNRLGTPVPPRAAKRFTPEQRHALGIDTLIATIDPPLHRVYRRPINKHFSVPAIAKLTDMTDRIIDDLINEVADKDEFDFAQEVAAELPMRLILGFLGAPQEDWKSLQETVNRYALHADPAYTIDNDPIKTMEIARQQLSDYAIALAEDRAKNPRDDLATKISALKVDGDNLSPHEIRNWFINLILGGLETSINGLGTGMWQFIENPDQRDLLLSDPSLVPNAVEEVLRWGSPSRVQSRIANDDITIGGKEIKAGDWVFLFAASGNRDESVWEEPDRFNIGRELIDHLSFGEGIHKCLGRNLIRLEMARFFPKFLAAFPKLSLAGEPVWNVDFHGNGFKRLPVTHNNVVVR
ncbi:cytochrome P450 [Georgenia sp. AZ-5]|uniref:cytochrome P450 n=1 Tax=Georgenia sp. AZ-5 TaxID=3367526 RepID=UPI0037541E2D